MSKRSTKQKPPQIDTQVLSDFIYDLNIARRQLTLYPPGHPQIISSSQTVLRILAKLCEFRESVSFGVAPDTLMFEGAWLDENNPVYRDFARFLSSLDIAAIHFDADLTDTELINFNQILRNLRDNRQEPGGIQTLLEQQKIKHISVTAVDYGSFRGEEEFADTRQATDNQLWEDLLSSLLSDTALQPPGDNPQQQVRTPSAVAAQLNRLAETRGTGVADYDQAISSFIARVSETEKPAGTELSQKLGDLITNLNPELRRNFLDSTFQAIDRYQDKDTAILHGLPQDMIVEAVRTRSQGDHNISERLVDLLGSFAGNTPADSPAERQDRTEQDEILKARIEVLLVEDSHDEYIPTNYQSVLQNILTGRATAKIPEQVTGRLKNSLDKHAIEQHSSTVIFNMLRHKVDAETEAFIQQNLVELSEFFLDTGDFNSLREIFNNWSEYLYSSDANARFLDEKVLATQTREVFMNEVLDNISLWGTGKYDEICTYIEEVGEPYAELLVERLAVEEQMALRKTWMKLLVELGSRAHPIILRGLDDERWYLVRNLLIVLGRQKEAIPLKAVQQLASHRHPKVRQEALRIIIRHNPATANRQLLKELSSGDKNAIQAAVAIAELSNDLQILNILHQLLLAEPLEEADLVLKKQIIHCLACKGRPESIPILARLLKKKRLIRSRREKILHHEIINSLGAYPPHTVTPLLNALIKGHDRKQSSLARAQLINREETCS